MIGKTRDLLIIKIKEATNKSECQARICYQSVCESLRKDTMSSLLRVISTVLIIFVCHNMAKPADSSRCRVGECNLLQPAETSTVVYDRELFNSMPTISSSTPCPSGTRRARSGHCKPFIRQL